MIVDIDRVKVHKYLRITTGLINLLPRHHMGDASTDRTNTMRKANGGYLKVIQ